MEYLEGRERIDAEKFLGLAALMAKSSGCSRAKCGAVIISQKGKTIGGGFNSPAGGDKSRNRCDRRKSEYDEKVTDKTCCVHAEQRAIMSALSNNKRGLAGSTMYFARFDENMGLSDHRDPYCTICSKMVVDVGIKFFVRYQNGDVIRYGSEEYDDLSANHVPQSL